MLHLSRRSWILVALAFAALRPGPALSLEIVEFPAPYQTQTSLIPGPDGNLYFGGGRISPDGTVVSFSPGNQVCDPANPYPAAVVTTLAFDRDGNLWFTMDCPGPYFPPYPPSTTAFIGRITPGGVQGRVINSQPSDLILGPDGNLWFSGGGVSRITSDFVIETFQIPGSGGTYGLTNGPDGRIWYTGSGTIGKISTSGVVKQYELPSPDRNSSNPITAGPDGNIWFTESRFTGNGFDFFIARSTPSGEITDFPLPSRGPGRISGPARMTAGPDGNVWYTEPGNNLNGWLDKVGRVTPDGTITEFSTPTPNSGPTGIAAGPDGNIWFTEPSIGKIGRVNLNQNGNCVPTATAPCPGRGSRWEEAGPPYRVIHSMAMPQDGSDTLYAAASDSTTSQSGVFRSDDSGATWTLLANALPGDTASTIAIDPRDSRRLLTTASRQNGSSTRVYMSPDSGVTWRLGGDFPMACGGTFAFDASDPLAVYVNLACSGELLASRDAGLTWENRNSSLKLLRSGPNGLLYAVRFADGVVFSEDGGFSWGDLGSPPCPYDVSINALAVDPLGRLFAGTGQIQRMFVLCPGLFQSDTGGSTWTEISRGQISPLYVTEIVIDSSEPSRLYAASFHLGVGNVFATADGGDNWRTLGLPVPASALALSKSGAVLFAGTNQGLYRLSIRHPRVVPPR